jgi:hypothetical protein
MAPVSRVAEVPSAGVGAEEARAFADTVTAIVVRHAEPDRWRPGAAVSDQTPALDEALREAGWEELGRDEVLLPLAAPAGAALGRGLASLAPVDRLLGGALKVGDLARYATQGGPLVEPRAAPLALTSANRLSPLPYTDALGVAQVETAAEGPRVEAAEEAQVETAAKEAQVEAAEGAQVETAAEEAQVETAAEEAQVETAAEEAQVETAAEQPQVEGGERARVRMAAWCAASTGYFAGLAEEALRLALEHARSRRAFGAPLTALEPVQQMLADAATLVDGLTLLTSESRGMDALAHAGEAAERAVAICMQVTGALGFTLEFPLQRAYRRSRSARAWADAVLVAWEAPVT